MTSAKYIIIGSGNGMFPVLRQAISKTSGKLLSFGPLATNHREIFWWKRHLSLKKMLLKMSSAKRHPRYSGHNVLIHWGRVTHIYVGNLTIIGPDNGLSLGRRQAIIWTNAGILLIGPWGTNFSEILIGIQAFSFKKMHLKMSSAKWCPFCLGLNVLNHWPLDKVAEI